jgi:hypothetical protein
LRPFSARAWFGKLEIHEVFLRFPHCALTKNGLQIALAELCGLARGNAALAELWVLP